MIRLKNIYKSYSMGEVEVPALRNVYLHVKPKDSVRVLRLYFVSSAVIITNLAC